MSRKIHGRPLGQHLASAAGSRGFLDIAGLLGVEGRAGRYLLASFVLHIAVAISLFMSWDFLRDDEVLVIPEYIDAHVISQQELEQLMARKDDAPKKPEPKKEVEPPEPEPEQEEERKQEIEDLERELEAQKKALLQKKEDERKEKEKKEKLEKEKLAKEKKEKEKKEKEKKEIERKEKEKKEKERKDKEKKEKEKKEKDKKEKERKEKEKKDLEKLRQEREANLMKKLAEAEARENAQQAVEADGKAATARELTEVERFMALIKKRIEDVWRKPPESGDLMVEFRIRLLPNGELAGVDITSSSGVVPFDRSALNAVQANMTLPVPDDRKLFEKHFREFNMRFRGQD